MGVSKGRHASAGALQNQEAGVKEALGIYERALGQTINFVKMDVCFSKGVRSDERSSVAHCLDILGVLSFDKYLRLPTFVGRSWKKHSFLLLMQPFYY